MHAVEMQRWKMHRVEKFRPLAASHRSASLLSSKSISTTYLVCELEAWVIIAEILNLVLGESEPVIPLASVSLLIFGPQTNEEHCASDAAHP